MSGSEVVSFEEVLAQYSPNDNITSPIMTKYEFAKVIGQRMEQLARDSPSLVDASSHFPGNTPIHESYRKIAEAELKQRVLPFMIVRTLPNSKKECWRISDMIVPGF